MLTDSETIIEAVCITCAATICRHSVPLQPASYWTGRCDACGRPGLVADPETFGGLRRLAEARG